MRPIIERVSQWDSMREIIWCCPSCNASFNFYGHTKQNFCHNCGEYINWTDYPIKVDAETAKRYHNSDCYTQREIIKELNDSLNKKYNKKL